MSSRMLDVVRGSLEALRQEPLDRRVRARLGGEVVVDSPRALLVWEPRRVVPSYAVPVGDVAAELTPATDQGTTSDAPVLHPGIPFGAHSTPGVALDVRAGGDVRPLAAFRPEDPDLAGHVVLDFRAFDDWLEEDDPVVGHPRDPFHRVDIRPSSRRVRVLSDGAVLADSVRPTLVFETGLPTRFYLPAEDLRVEPVPSDRRTTCAYKGHARYWSFDVDGTPLRDVAWTYEQPLHDAEQLSGLVAFFDELVDVELDGTVRERPDTPESRAIVDGARKT